MKTTRNINYLVQTFTKSLLCSNHSMDYHLDVWQTAHNFAKGLHIQGLTFDTATIECIADAIAAEGIDAGHHMNYVELRKTALNWCAQDLIWVLAEQVDVWQVRIKIEKNVKTIAEKRQRALEARALRAN